MLASRLIAGRGGYCFELNTVLAGLLRACGFEVTMHQAVVGGDGPVNHMALLVHLDEGIWLADAGLGEGFLDPLPFREGTFEHGPFTWSLADEGTGTWWLTHHEWGTFSGFRMQLEPSNVTAFEEHHQRLSTSPESSFVKTLVVQKPQADRITTLRSRTLTSVGPSVDTKRLIEDVDDFTATLARVFGLSIAGERRDRLWAAALVQHRAFQARETERAA